MAFLLRVWEHEFFRHQTAAFIATILDFSLLFLLTELFGVWYVAATAVGSGTGAVVNFLLGRHWCFEVTHRGPWGQAVRYAITAGMSMGLVSTGVWMLTEFVHVPYGFSRVLAGILVAVAFNFPMHRWFVFRR